MLLDRIDIDAHGPLQRVELGPFSEHLNVVCGPEGGGKTAIARFVRDSLVNREYPSGMLSSSTGRVVFADRNGLVHCRREKDGTAQGRRTVEFESRGDFDPGYGPLQNAWLSGITSSTDSRRAVESLQIPEAIVDCVVTDTAGASVARVVSACVRSGLDCQDAYSALPLTEDSIYDTRETIHRHSDNGIDSYGERRYESNRQLRSQLADVEAELGRLGNQDRDYESLVARRTWLTEQLSRAGMVWEHRDSTPTVSEHDRTRTESLQARLSELHDRARHLRARQSELRRWVSDLNVEPANRHSTVTTPRQYHDRAVQTDAELSRRLEDLDAQMIRWRRALSEVRGLRRALLSGASGRRDYRWSPVDEQSLRRLRLDGFLHAVDRYDRSRRWDDLYPESYRPIHQLDDIDHRIHSAKRQIDWLLDRYGRDRPQSAWYESGTHRYRSASTLDGALRAIRDDLQQIHRQSREHVDLSSRRPVGDLEELRRSEEWLVISIQQLDSHRESLMRNHDEISTAKVNDWSMDTHYDRHVFHRERNDRLAELDRVTASLDACLGEAAQLRREMRGLPVVDGVGSSLWDPGDRYDGPRAYDYYRDRESFAAELRSIDAKLASLSRVQWLRTRRSQLLDHLGVVRKRVVSASPLADAASRWLVRLTAGRLRRVAWTTDHWRRDLRSFHRDSYQRTGVTIQERDEADCPAIDRALAVTAVRLAAGDFLARTGRHVPILFETHREMFDNVVRHPHVVGEAAYYQHGEHLASNHPLAAALRDYASNGRQVVILTSNRALSDQLGRVGARTFEIQAQRIVHGHRPLWKSQYDVEQYRGPHPHTYALHDVEEVVRASVEYDRSPRANVNRDFDMAWREAFGLDDNPDRVAVPDRGHRHTDWARDGMEYRDGYYFAETYTTVAAEDSSNAAFGLGRKQSSRNGKQGDRTRKPASPFFLTVDSPIDQAPSIDAVASARLRGVKVTHITHLMQRDPNRLADALGLANVDAATIRRWQAECRLVCRVPQLRGFDARVLVGCGITTPAELAATHPVDLLQEVEAFLATERGQQILLSGTSHELSRITSWIAAANSAPESELVSFGSSSMQKADQTSRSRRSYYRGFRDEDGSDQSRHEYDSEKPSERRRRRRQVVRTTQERQPEPDSGRSKTKRSRKSREWSSDGSSRSGRSDRRRNSESTKRRVVRYEHEVEVDAASEDAGTKARELRFYLHRESPVVDAPSIGERMAERLQGIEIYTVDDLLNSDPESVATELDHRRVDADTVVQWQQQATLVCRVPMLRGHDAQLLVAAEVVTPETLAEYDAEELFGMIEPIAHSNEGKRILRGGKLPDLEEITDWISFAQHTRELRAA